MSAPDQIDRLARPGVEVALTMGLEPALPHALPHAPKASRYSGAVAAAALDARYRRVPAQAGVTRIPAPFDDAADHTAEALVRGIDRKPRSAARPQEPTA